jgi:hypothetical protein
MYRGKEQKGRMRIRDLKVIIILSMVLVVFMTGTAMAVDPQAPASLAQYKEDGTTAIAQGGTTDEATVTIKATVTDADSTAQLQVEIMDTRWE